MLRQKHHWHDRFENCVRLRGRDGFDLQQSRVRYASREERYYEDYNTDTEQSVGRFEVWGDREFEDYGYVTNQNWRLGREKPSSRRP